MKRLLLIPLLALPLIAQPVPTVNVTGTARVGAIWPHDLTLEWHMESLTAEFSVGDWTASPQGYGVLTNTVTYDGAQSYWNFGSMNRAVFTITSDDLVDEDQGTVTFHAYVVTNLSGASFWVAYGNATNAFYCTMLSTRQVRLYHKRDGVSHHVTTTGTFNTNEWFSVECKWRKTTAPQLSVTLNNDTPNTYSTTNLFDLATPAAELHVGDRFGIEASFYLDDFRAYKAWK
jgi:hypothetical protein